VQGDLSAAERVLSEALDMDRKFNRRRPMAYSTFQLGEVALMRGDFALAKQRHADALAIRTALGEKGTAAESQSALAVIALEEGRAAEAERLASEAAAVFASQSAPDNEAMARATVALAMLAQGRHAPAAREVERAQALVKSPQHVLARMPVLIAAARVTSESNQAAALSSLEALRAEAVKRGIARAEFDARRAIAEIEGRRSLTRGATLIATLRADAKGRGFGLYAR
jgi:tetratricopeptide (TPR) repeat protein